MYYKGGFCEVFKGDIFNPYIESPYLLIAVGLIKSLYGDGSLVLFN